MMRRGSGQKLTVYDFGGETLDVGRNRSHGINHGLPHLIFCRTAFTCFLEMKFGPSLMTNGEVDRKAN